MIQKWRRPLKCDVAMDKPYLYVFGLFLLSQFRHKHHQSSRFGIHNVVSTGERRLYSEVHLSEIEKVKEQFNFISNLQIIIII